MINMWKIIFFCLFCSMTSMAQDRPQNMIYSVPDKHNQKVIKRYNRYHFKPNVLSSPTGVLDARSFTDIWGVNTNSLMSNDDIEVNFVKKWVENPIYNDMDDRMYFVVIKNKTDKTIYIDRGYSFKIYNNGCKLPYYDPNLQTDTCSKTKKRYIAIPPHSKRNLSDYLWVKKGNGNYAEITEYPEDFQWSVGAARVYKGFLRYGEARRFTENNSPYHRSFLITYSKEKDFSTYSLLMINFYLRELIGMYYPELYKENFGDLRMYGADEYTITSCTTIYD